MAGHIDLKKADLSRVKGVPRDQLPPQLRRHEAMYLGDGMMLEAPYTGSQVKVSPVRSSGMTPYVTRLIEY